MAEEHAETDVLPPVPWPQEDIFEWHFAIRGAWDSEFEVRAGEASEQPAGCLHLPCGC